MRNYWLNPEDYLLKYRKLQAKYKRTQKRRPDFGRYCSNNRFFLLKRNLHFLMQSTQWLSPLKELKLLWYGKTFKMIN